MIDKHTLDILEFPKVIALITGQCLTPYGRERIDRIEPLFDSKEISRRLLEISQMKDIINFGSAFPLFRVEDCRELIHKTTTEGSFLEPPEMLVVNELVVLSINLTAYDREGRDKYPSINDYLQRLRAFPELKKDIERAIDEKGEVKDNASSQLKRIRAEMGQTRRRIMNMLEKIMASSTKQPGWQDDLVTMRNGRYVIPVPSSQYKTDVGILHDRSQSGATLYIEPSVSVESNNRINLLYQEERVEIDRILRALTSEIGTRAEALLENCRLVGTLDGISASARFSNLIKGNAPNVCEEASFDLITARHPLLINQFGDIKKVIPNSIALDDSCQSILVTGPNTGGKTVLLKTIGLCVLMAQSGLHISADENSEVGIFKNMFADIGDEQSLELSLSTFSSHLRNIIDALNDADESALLLFDEIGAGTDPGEGAALAEAIILDVLKKKAKLIASTHYSQLKTLAQEHPEIENASMEFDRDTLAPTYRINLGIPGSSYAIEIAARLGMASDICDHASSLVGSGEKSLSALISSLESELSQIKEDKKQLSVRLEKAKELETYFKVQSDHLKDEVETEKKKMLDETEAFVNDTRRDIERLVSEIRASDAGSESLKEFHGNIKQRQQQLNQMKKTEPIEPVDQTVYNEGDAVRIISLDQAGEIYQLMGTDKAKVKIGNFTTTVEFRNLEKITKAEKKRIRKTSGQVKVEQVESPEIHLRGMTVEEAMESLENFLDRAVLSGLTQVYVIHGKGTGTLRRQLTSYLKSHKEVESLRLGNWNEGGAGVTIAKLKK